MLNTLCKTAKNYSFVRCHDKTTLSYTALFSSLNGFTEISTRILLFLELLVLCQKLQVRQGKKLFGVFFLGFQFHNSWATLWFIQFFLLKVSCKGKVFRYFYSHMFINTAVTQSLCHKQSGFSKKSTLACQQKFFYILQRLKMIRKTTFLLESWCYGEKC